MKAKFHVRITLLTCTIGVIASVIILRLYNIQIQKHANLSDLATKQYVHTSSNLFNRGTIYMTTKDGEEVPAATVKSGFMVTINPSLIEHPDQTFEALRDIVPISKETFVEHATKLDDTYEEIFARLNEKDALTLKERGIEGVQLYRNAWRVYPYNDVGAHAIGFIGYDGNELVGRYGLEHYYNDRLLRKENDEAVNFFAEVFSAVTVGRGIGDTTEQADIITSLEPTVVATLTNALQKTHDKLKSKLTGGIIMDPFTGAILGMAVVPGYNPNDRTDTDVARFRNPLVEDFYELGSIIKPLTVAAGLDLNAITARSTYTDRGSLTLDGYTIYNFDKAARGVVSMQEVLNQSLNTGVAHIVHTMGRKKFREYFTNLELGTETGIDLPNETYGRIENLENPRDIEYATASFGQGIALTPIAAIRALAALGNGGVLGTPHIAIKLRLQDGTVRELSQVDPKRVWRETTSEEISRMLTVVVDTALRKGAVKQERYSIAAKTGTAQIANPKGGGYFEDRYLHSFFGYAPAYNPRFIIFLYTVEPQGVQYASETLTDPFMDLTKFLINYYNIPPDR
jgi:cell division protein FtsI/penicillin-binding protein 2